MLKFNGPNVKLAFDIDISFEPFGGLTDATKSSDNDDEDEENDSDEKQKSDGYEYDEDNENDLDESRLVMILKSNREKIALTCQKVNQFLRIFQFNHAVES